ncbi:RIO1 family regulatory kinase/ATPase [Marinobacter xestospongiae]|uniref:RIO1 family regulatory kinase/ATPase domain-containing protein n=1 Tax=Marinobacter xestospongiae TaxID=994319 RepID=UPI0020035889|nr:RIO1 family regulatory kinase/ATPase [Marinobacter xestospongiae]MCK7568936.1 hypothetical protein [Marinobacter xestospongiae]
MNSHANCPAMGSGIGSAKSELATGQPWYKPVISVGADSEGRKHVYKAFRFSRGLLGRYFRFLALHEFKMLKKVEHLKFTPSQVHRHLGASPTIHYRFIEGNAIKAVAQSNGAPEGFFSQLFNDVKTMHQSGVVHLDLGNSGNVLVSREGHPVVIDFGSAIPTDKLPPMVKDWALRKDLIGVLKLWDRFDRESMPELLQDYFRKHYRKNIYTPKRFAKAARRWVTGYALFAPVPSLAKNRSEP